MTCSRGIKGALNRLQRTTRGTGRLPDPDDKPPIPAAISIGRPVDKEETEQAVEPVPSVELYRVVSSIVTDPTGNWELPDGFPDTNTYPGETDGPDQSTFLESERTHELALLGDDGKISYSIHPTAWEQPYTGDAGYKPAWSLIKVTEAPSGFAAAFNLVDWPAIEADLASRWAGLAL